MAPRQARLDKRQGPTAHAGEFDSVAPRQRQIKNPDHGFSGPEDISEEPSQGFAVNNPRTIKIATCQLLADKSLAGVAQGKYLVSIDGSPLQKVGRQRLEVMFDGKAWRQAKQKKPAASMELPTNSRPVKTVQRNGIGDDISPSYISKSKPENEGKQSGRDQSLIHRGLVETEIVNDKKYVRAYQTVYASVEKGSSWKDTQQESSEKEEERTIKFLGKGDSWINFGNPLRALHYVRTYYAQAPGKKKEALDTLPKDDSAGREKVENYHGKPIVRSFLVPYDVYLEVTGSAISESQRKKLGAYNMNVDKSKASDQYQIMEKDVKKLAKTSLPDSMISYVMDHLVEKYKKDSRHGKVEGIKKLSEKLGLPQVFDKLTVPMEGTEVPNPKKQEIHARELGELYDLSFFMEKKMDHPKYRDSKITDQDYLNKYLNIEPRLSELAFKYLGTEVLSGKKEDRDKLRKKLASAANAALIPKLIEENYYEGTSAMYGKQKDDSPLEGYPEGLSFEQVLLDPRVKEKVAKLSNEEIQKRRREAEERKEKKEKQKPSTSSDEDDDSLLSNLFDSK